MSRPQAATIRKVVEHLEELGLSVYGRCADLKAGVYYEGGSLMDYDYREVRAAQAMMKNARQRYLAVDSSKFGRNAMMKLCHISEVNDVFTDDDPPAELAPILADKNVRLHVARAGEPILPEE